MLPLIGALVIILSVSFSECIGHHFDVPKT